MPSSLVRCKSQCVCLCVYHLSLVLCWLGSVWYGLVWFGIFALVTLWVTFVCCGRKGPCVRVSLILSKRLFYMVNNISADSVGVCQSLGTNAFSLEIIFPCRHAIANNCKIILCIFINQTRSSNNKKKKLFTKFIWFKKITDFQRVFCIFSEPRINFFWQYFHVKIVWIRVYNVFRRISGILYAKCVCAQKENKKTFFRWIQYVCVFQIIRKLFKKPKQELTIFVAKRRISLKTSYSQL